MRNNAKQPINDGFYGVASGYQKLDENTSESIPNVRSALQADDQSSDEADSPGKGPNSNNDDMYYDN